MNEAGYGAIEQEASVENANNKTNSRNKFLSMTSSMTRKELITVVLLSLFFFLNWTYFSIFPTVFPHEAMEKGMSQTQIGFIFGIFQLTLFLLYPFFGKYMNAIGIRFLFNGGLLLASTGAIAFAFLDRTPNGITYFILALFIRFVTGIGASMGISYAIVAYSFPNNVASVVAFLEFVSGLGFMAGPILGGTLFHLGGFQLPFLVVGGSMFLLFLVSLCIFPECENTVLPSGQSEEPAALEMLPLLKIPKFLLTLMIMFIACLGINFLEPTLQIHLLPLELKSYQLGFVFFVPAFTYTVFTPVVGFLSDKYPDNMPYLMMGSSCMSIVAYSILGPLPFINIPLYLPYFLIGYILFAIAYTGVMVPVYSDLNKISIKHGYPKDLRTQGLISGIFSCVHSMAAFIGPMIGGVAVEYIGYRYSIFIIILMLLSTGLLYTIVHFKGEGFDSVPIITVTSEEARAANTPLLERSNPELH